MKEKGVFRRLIEMSGRHVGIILRFHRLFTGNSFMRQGNIVTDYLRAKCEMRAMRFTENRVIVVKKYHLFNSSQKRVLNTVMNDLYSRGNDDTSQTLGKAMIVQGGSVVGKRDTLIVLRDMDMSRGFLAEIKATKGNAPAFNMGASCLHSLIRLGVDDKDDEGNNTHTSMYGP